MAPVTLGKTSSKTTSMLLVVNLALCFWSTSGHVIKKQGGLHTPRDQTELNTLLKKEVQHERKIFPGASKGIGGGHLFEPMLTELQKRRHGRVKRYTSQCPNDRVCGVQWRLNEDPNRTPRVMLHATCPNCAKCYNMGGTCTPVRYLVSVFRNCGSLRNSDCSTCQVQQETVSVGCTCVLDTLS